MWPKKKKKKKLKQVVLNDLNSNRLLIYTGRDIHTVNVGLIYFFCKWNYSVEKKLKLNLKRDLKGGIFFEKFIIFLLSCLLLQYPSFVNSFIK